MVKLWNDFNFHNFLIGILFKYSMFTFSDAPLYEDVIYKAIKLSTNAFNPKRNIDLLKSFCFLLLYMTFSNMHDLKKDATVL